MSIVIVDPLTSQKLVRVQCPVELCDKSGILLGHFIPSPDPRTQYQLDPQASDEELDRREREEGGSQLSEILADLQRRAK